VTGFAGWQSSGYKNLARPCATHLKADDAAEAAWHLSHGDVVVRV
jgi:hypothetical protein